MKENNSASPKHAICNLLFHTSVPLRLSVLLLYTDLIDKKRAANLVCKYCFIRFVFDKEFSI
jgi:hypothetical protein